MFIGWNLAISSFAGILRFLPVWILSLSLPVCISTEHPSCQIVTEDHPEVELLHFILHFGNAHSYHIFIIIQHINPFFAGFGKNRFEKEFSWRTEVSGDQDHIQMYLLIILMPTVQRQWPVLIYSISATGQILYLFQVLILREMPLRCMCPVIIFMLQM